MNRRDSLRYLTLSGGVLISGVTWTGCADLTNHYSFFTSEENKIMTALVDTIIPGGGTPEQVGALNLGVDALLKQIIEKCHPEETHTLVKSQLGLLNTGAKTKYQKPFFECSQENKEVLLSDWRAADQEEKKKFFDLIKSQTMMIYRTSEKILVENYGYELAPGRYLGCVKVG